MFLEHVAERSDSEAISKRRGIDETVESAEALGEREANGSPSGQSRKVFDHVNRTAKIKAQGKPRMLWVCHPLMLHRKRSHGVLYAHLSGSERTERLSHLQEDGYDVHLIAADFQKEYFQRYRNIHLISVPIRYFPVISFLLYGLVLFIYLPFYILKHRPDFVISDSSPALFLTWKPFLSRALRFKMILDIRSTPMNSKGKRGSLRNVYFKLSVFVAKIMFDGMTIVTPMMRDEICQEFNISPTWTGILSNGISEGFLQNEKQNTERDTELKRKLGLSGKFLILYHGAIRARTGGLVESVKAIGIVKNDCPQVVLLILGAGLDTDRHLLEDTIKDYAVQDRVKLLGAVDFHDVPKYISMCDLGLVPLPNIPTWRHQQPLKLLEYMAMGKTVIVSDSPAHRSIVGKNMNGIYVSHVNPEELAAAIEYAYDHRDTLDKWGKTGREIVKKKYVWKKVNEDLVDYLMKVKSGENRLKISH